MIRKRFFIPLISALIAAILLLSPIAPVQHFAIPDTGQSLGQILHSSGNPFAHTFSDTKDIRTATIVVAASDSKYKYNANLFCNGTADQVEIQAAIDALPAGGGSIQLLDGIFTLKDIITINKSWVLIHGTDGTQIDLDHSGGKVDEAFLIAADHIEISNINFSFTDTTVLAAPPAAIAALSNTEYEYISIHDCSFIGVNTAGSTGALLHTTIGKAIETAAGKYWNISNNFFEGCSWEGISIGNYASAGHYPEHIIAVENTIVGLSDRCYGGIVTEHGARHCVIANNNISKMKVELQGYGIYVIGGDGLPGSQNIAVVSNVIDDVEAQGILIMESQYVTCSGNSISNCDYAGIQVTDMSSHTVISGNVITHTWTGIDVSGHAYDTHISGNLVSGMSQCISFQDISKLTIFANDLSYAGYAGIVQPWDAAGFTSSHIVIANNLLRNMNTRGGAYPHMYIEGTVDDLIVRDNVFKDTQSSDTTTLAAGANIGETVITVADVTSFSYSEAIKIGTAPNDDDVLITDIDYYNSQITFTPALANNQANGNPVVGRNTSVMPIDTGTITSSELVGNNWEGLNADPAYNRFTHYLDNIAIDGDWWEVDDQPIAIEAWVTHTTTNPSLGTIPPGTYVMRVHCHVTEVFDAGGVDDAITVGYDADVDAFATAIDVHTAVGVQTVTMGAEEGYEGTERAAEAYLTWTGGNPTQGKALIKIELQRVPTQP